MFGSLEYCSPFFGTTTIGGPMIIFGVLILAALGYLIYIAARGRRNGTGPLRDSPADILKARYARGEISRQEYLDMLSDIRDS